MVSGVASWFVNARAALRQGWRERQPRERRLIAAAAIVLVPAVLIFGVLLPVHDRLRALEDDVPRLRTQLALMQEMAARAAGSGTAGAGSSAVSRDLVARVEAALAAHGGFRGSVTRSDSGVDVVVEEAAFDALLARLATLQRSDAVFAVETRLQAGTRPGTVSGRIRLATGSGR